MPFVCGRLSANIVYTDCGTQGENMDEIVKKIISLLKEQHKTQKNLTDYLGITQNAFTDWKSGRIKSYTKHLEKIAEFFGVSVDYLIGSEHSVASNINTSDIGALSSREVQLISSYRTHPELQHAVEILLGIDTSEKPADDDDTIVLYTAAHSDDNRPEMKLRMPKERWEKLKNAPETDETLL